MTFHDKRSHRASQPGVAGRMLTLADLGYPHRLREMARPPSALWVKGKVPGPAEPVLAMVGSRAASRRGWDVAHAMASQLGRRGFAVVSGGAFGVDAASHEGALAAGTATYAVLGCGTDVVYPDRHGQLFGRIASSGGLLSEYAPGTPPRAGQFPARNRLIVALADAVIVVEAAVHSGALITAQLAVSGGRPLFALPGSPGTDALLRAGAARAVQSATDVEQLLAGGEGGACSVSAPMQEMASRFAHLVKAIADGVDTPVRLGEHLGLTLPDSLALLAEAEIEGVVVRVGGTTYEVIGRGC